MPIVLRALLKERCVIDIDHGQVSIDDKAMVLVDMPPPSSKAMIAFVHKEHLSRKRSKVFVLY